MSKVGNAFFAFSFAFLYVVLAAITSLSQNIVASAKVDTKKSSVSVSGSYLGHEAAGQRRHLSFLKSGIGLPDLANRISNLMLADKTGKLIAYKRLDAGEFVSEADFVRWSYKTNIAVPKNPRASAHVSWLSNNYGILMLDYLFPQFSNAAPKVSATVTIEIPEGWKIFSTEKRVGPATFEVTNIEKAVFVVGTDLREKKVNIGSSVLNVATAGRWLFTDAESAKIGEEIYSEYLRIFASSPAENFQISIVPFPQNYIQTSTWEADTRGRTVTIVSADMPFKTQSVQRLNEQLRHEIFHLWLPNGVSLSGNYDWFYEGFALYQSLKTGVALNQIRFEDFLDTLSRAHNIDTMQTSSLSLVEASQNRWNGADTQVYARGMLVAFMCDLVVLQSSKGRNSIDHIFRKLYASHRPPNPVSDANTSILKVLELHPQLAPVVERYIKGSQKIDWQIQLDAAGIENEPGNSGTNLRVKAKLNGGQKALLDKLGYNNWRKLARKS